MSNQQTELNASDPTWLRALFAPRSVAIIGSSDDASRASGRIQYYLDKWGYQGAVYPVNPRRSEVQGKPAYPSVSAIDDEIDVAIVMVAASLVPDALRDCVEARVGAVVVGSSGFAEVGPEGIALENEIADICDASGLRMIGPNGNGVVSASCSFAASFMSGLDTERFELKDDGLALVSQSGAIGAFIVNMGQGSGLGVGKYVSTGNETNVGFSELVEALVDSADTSAVLGYVEGLRDGQRFIGAARHAAERVVPLVVLKVGTTDEGAQAAASHTSSLAGSDAVYEGVFEQMGVIRARTISHLLDVGRIVATGREIGRRITVATISGGAGILVTDRAIQTGLELAEWDEASQDELRTFLPAFASLANPIDATGQLLTDGSTLEKLMSVVGSHEGTDVLMLILGNGEKFETSMAERIIEAALPMSKPVVVVWPGGSGEAMRILNLSGIPAFDDPVRCVEALAPVARRVAPSPASMRSVQLQRRPVAVDDPVPLDEHHSKRVLAAFGLPVLHEVVVESVDRVGAATESLAYPLVAKIRSRALTHKSDVGGVRLGLRDRQEAEQAVAELLELASRLGLRGADVILAPMVEIGVELILGATIDPTFGPVVTVGIGGVLTELLRDSVTLLPDFTDDELERALDRLVLRPMLQGFRGAPAVPLHEVAAALRAVALAIESEELGAQAIDVNPIVMTNSGSFVALDAVVYVSDEGQVAAALALGDGR